ncbi:hypothetical protein LCGC14_1336420 [marine sediment metagenome]|uniref:Uncharacterized protein n=1 Tax=marine sediment metagenome TaxID=412755 RepID=A0A0F9NHG3_9ZZZZ
MKAFEEWYILLPIKEDAEDQSLETQAKYKKGWEAALKWVLSEIYEHREVMDVIEEELEEK